MSKLNIRAMLQKLLDEDVLPAEVGDLDYLDSATHFGRKVSWVYTDMDSDWPITEPRPVLMPLGIVPLGIA